MASVATLLYPRVAALAAWEAGLKGAAAPLWVPVHLGLALGMALLIPGVATLHSLLVRRGVARLLGRHGGIPGAWLPLAAYRLWREAGDIRSAAVRS